MAPRGCAAYEKLNNCTTKLKLDSLLFGKLSGRSSVERMGCTLTRRSSHRRLAELFPIGSGLGRTEAGTPRCRRRETRDAQLSLWIPRSRDREASSVEHPAAVQTPESEVENTKVTANP